MALFPIRRFRVREYRQEAVETFTLVLEPADGLPMFSFIAGQFVMMHLYNDDGSVWAKAAYSIATAPSESDEIFELGIKLHGDFTRRAAGLKIGDQVGIQGPYGVFCLKELVEGKVFFAGGVGVTPLRSMIRSALFTELQGDVWLFYSEKQRAAMAYEAEFRDLSARYPQFHFIPILTRETPSAWDGEIGRMQQTMIEKYLHDWLLPRYYMCGPKQFMDDLKQMLVNVGVDVHKQLHRESFGN